MLFSPYVSVFMLEKTNVFIIIVTITWIVYSFSKGWNQTLWLLLGCCKKSSRKVLQLLVVVGRLTRWGCAAHSEDLLSSSLFSREDGVQPCLASWLLHWHGLLQLMSLNVEIHLLNRSGGSGFWRQTAWPSLSHNRPDWEPGLSRQTEPIWAWSSAEPRSSGVQVPHVNGWTTWNRHAPAALSSEGSVKCWFSSCFHLWRT